MKMPSGPDDELTLKLRRELPATPEQLYRALTSPKLLALWWGPQGFSAPSVEVDLRVGGMYRITMQPPNGAVFHVWGVFREIVPASRLAYTFNYEEPDPDDQETVVTLFLDGEGQSAVVVMNQGVFATRARRALHQQGWSESLDKLEMLLSRQENFRPDGN